MIAATDFARLNPVDRAALIYAQAHGDVSARLWRAALGTDASAIDYRGQAQISESPGSSLDSLLAMITQKTGLADPKPQGALLASAAVAVAQAIPAAPVVASAIAAVKSFSAPVPFAAGIVAGLGPNTRFGQALVAAAERTGIPAPALAAIVDAEAAKGSDGSWKTASRNPRSSAAGLGQFLGGTWQSEAERTGTWLHDTARNRGWIGGNGRVLAAAKSSLLALRYDATASINATADYASRSVSHLKRAGIDVGEDLTTIARAAYLGHHLGTGDAVRFLTNGLDNSRAKRLLSAQVGSLAAGQRISRNSDAASAHRSWLLEFVDRHITPARFTSVQ